MSQLDKSYHNLMAQETPFTYEEVAEFLSDLVVGDKEPFVVSEEELHELAVSHAVQQR